jgi:hypothetical protein
MVSISFLCFGPTVEMPEQIVGRLSAAHRPNHGGGIFCCGNRADDDLGAT